MTLSLRYVAAALILGLVALVIALALPSLLKQWREWSSWTEAKRLPTIKIGTLRGGLSTLDAIKYLKLDLKRGVRLEVFTFDRTLDLACALERGDLDVAIIPVELVGKLREKGDDVVLIAVDMLQNQAVIGRPELNASSLLDLKGRRVGVFRPTGTYAMLKAYAKAVYGLELERDFVIVDAPPMQLVEALIRGEVDAVVLWEPLASKLLASGAELVESFSELWSRWEGSSGLPVMIVYAARGGWAREHPDLVRVLQQVRAEAAKKWNSDEGLAREILRKAYGLDDKAARLCWARVKFVEVPEITPELEESVKRVWELAKEGGYLSASPSELARGAFWHG